MPHHIFRSRMLANSELPNGEKSVEPTADVSRQRVTKVKFTPEQDRKILSLLKENPTTSWRTVAEHIEGKTAKQCRERYQHFLAPTVERKPWTADEDFSLCCMYHALGPKWAVMASSFPGRTNQDLKNRFNWHLRNRCQLDVFLDVIKSRTPLMTVDPAPFMYSGCCF